MKKIYIAFFLCFISFLSFAQTTWTVGTGTLTNASTLYPAPYGNWYTSGHGQFLYLASELTAAGVSAGTIDKIAFNVSALNGASPVLNFNVGMANTPVASLSSMLTTTNYYTSASNSQTTGWNVIPFSSAFVWDGISNIVVDVCWCNCASCTNYTYNPSVYQTATSYTSCLEYYADGIPNPCGTSTLGSNYTQHPNIQFTRNCNVLDTARNFGPGCSAGGPVQLTGSSSNATSYLWTGPGGYSTTVQNPTTTVAGIYTLAATGTCTATSNTTVVINPTPISTITATGVTTFCQGGSILLSGSTGAGLSYQWYNGTPGAGTLISGAVNSAYTATASGSYYLSVTNSYGCSATSSAFPVTVNPSPAVSISPATAAFCSGGSALLTASPATGLTYQWKRNNNSLTGATNSTYTATGGGTYTVVASNSYGCTATSSTSVVTQNPVPDAAATTNMPTSFCQGGNVTLSGISGTGVTFQWQQNGSSITGATNLNYTATTSGTYDLIATNTFGCTYISNSLAVTANTAPAASITATGPTTFCPGGNVTFDAGAGVGYTFQWAQNGVPIPGADSAYYNASSGGSYNVAVTNASGCSSSSSAIAVSVGTFPTAVATAQGATAFCEGGMVTLSANAGAGLTYNWQIDGADIGVTSSTYTVGISNNYDVEVTNATGCSTVSNIVNVAVTPAPSVNVYPIGSTILCQGESVSFLAAAAAGVNFIWQMNGNNIPGATNSQYTTLAAGTYDVIASDTGSCTTTSPSFAVSVFPLPVAHISASGSTSICTGDTILLNANAGAGLNYQWLQNGLPVYGATSGAFKAFSAGAYTLAEYSGNNCTDTSAAVSVILEPLPVPVINSSGSFLSTATYASYQWYINGAPIPGATNQSYLATDNAGYTVSVVNSNGCSGVSTEAIVNNVGVATIKGSNSISIYPNPNNGIFTIGGTLKTQDNLVQIEVTDVVGKVLLRDKATVNNGVINKEVKLDENLASGMYLIRIISNSETLVFPAIKK